MPGALTRASRLGLVIGLVVLVLDQASKYWAVHFLAADGQSPVVLLPVLDLVLTHNPGISYSLFRADGPLGRLVLIAVALGALAVIAVWIARTPSRWTASALGAVGGGAAGNVIDRIRTGAVIDFLYFHTPFSLGPLSNYVFNVADAAIVMGAAILLYESFTSGRPAQDGAPVR